MDVNAANVSFLDFVGGVQLLQGGGDDPTTRTAVPVLLIGICVSGALGNLLLLLIFTRDFTHAKGSEVKALLASVASTDLAILLLCAPVRALTFSTRTWTLGGFACSTADWFQHACVVAKTLTLAVTTRAKHTLLPTLSGATWIHGALAFVWTVSLMFPIPQLLYASLVPRGRDFICVSEMPACASDFMRVFYKVYPTATFVAPVAFTLAYYTKELHAAVNHDARPTGQHQSKVTLVLLCLSGAHGLMLTPEWGAFTWIRLGYEKPPVGLTVFAQVALYACSALSPVILMTMYDDVRQGLVTLWLVATCRGARRQPRGNACPKTEDNGAEVGAVAVETEKTFPDVEHFWTGRRNTHVEEAQDPVPWEREEKML